MPRFVVEEPSIPLAALLRDALVEQGCETREVGAWPQIDASSFLHDEARLLDANELGDARAALLEDGVFSESSLESLAPGLGVDDESALRAAVKYGWTLAVAQQSAQGPIELLVDHGTTQTTALEHRFLVSEIERRGLDVLALALCTPAPLEPAIAAQELTELRAWLVEHEGIGGPPLRFAHMEMKWDLLPLVAKHAPNALCGLCRVAWLEVLRKAARDEPVLFREILLEAQARFALEKDERISATTEDDIRSLPLVEDALLESTFLDDFRGRQLLYVAAPALSGDARVAALFNSDPVAELIRGAAERYASAIRL